LRLLAAPTLAALASVLALTTAGFEEKSAEQSLGNPSVATGIQLELPEFGPELHPPGVLRVPQPQEIQQVVIHVPKEKVHKAFPRINTQGTGPIHHVRVRRGETLYRVNMALNESKRYDFGLEANTIEIKVTYRPGADPVYVKWVVLPPEEGESWVTEEAGGGGGEARTVAAMGSEGVKILEEQKDGTLLELGGGWTAARRVFIQASFAQKQESVSLRIHQSGDDGSPKTSTVGTWRSGNNARNASRGVMAAGNDQAFLEAPIELKLGKNQLEVEVVHGYETLSRTIYRIVRRTPTDPREIAGEKWAVIIGVSDYQAEGMDLNYAHKDAQALHNFLVERSGFAPQRIRLLTDGAATRQAIDSALFTFLASTKPDDLVFLFMAGHGVQDAKNPDLFYFLAHDSRMDDLGGTALPMRSLGDVMNHAVKARNIIAVADTCRSGAAPRRAGVVDGTGLNFFNKYLETLAQKRGRLVLTASQAHQSSLEVHRFGHGVFTHFLLQGLEGEADDNPADGVVTAGEIVDFVRQAVPKETDGKQHPSFRDVGFDLNLPLSHLPVEALAEK